MLEFLQGVGLLRRADDVDERITLYQYPSLTGTASYHITLLDVLPSRRPVCRASAENDGRENDGPSVQA